MKYDDYIEKIAKRFKASLDGIAAHYNFDHGVEFEIAICKTLRIVLPSRFGICRGFLVDADGQRAGDDIIIYDCERFPTLRVIEDDCFALKQSIPIEAAYAYIEAKHSLTLSGTDETFEKAINQITQVKELAAKREEVTLEIAIDPYMVISQLQLDPNSRPEWPRTLNPFYGAVIARQVRESKGKTPLSAAEVRSRLAGRKLDTDFPPDLIVAGDDVVGLPVIERNGVDFYRSPFAIDEQSHIRLEERTGLAFAIGVCSLLYALDTIRLGIMPWPTIIADAIGVELTNRGGTGRPTEN